MMWSQVYNPFGNAVISTLVASIPVAAMLIMLAFLHVKAHWAAIIALLLAVLIATAGFTMPPEMALKATFLGLLNGFFPIGWIILNVIFLYRLCVDRGALKIVQDSLGAITPDRRLQLLLIAFSFGAFFEGAAGFGTPVAVTGAILIGLGFSPLAASGLALIANTAPVAFGALGTPIVTLAAVMKLTDNVDHDAILLGAMIGRQLPLFSFIVPFWLIAVFAGWRGMLQIWPAILICGLSFAIPQYVISNYHGPWLVDVGAALISMAALTAFLRVWSPKEIWLSPQLRGRIDHSVADMGQTVPGLQSPQATRGELIAAWTPWIILCLFVLVWGTQTFKDIVNPYFLPKWPIEGLHNLIQKVPPAVPVPAKEGAVFSFNILTMSGTGILLAALVSGAFLRYSPFALVKEYIKTLWIVRYSLVTISAMLALGTLTRYSGIDATLGLAFANTGFFYPFFGTMLGWLGVALTGSDTASNVLFGGLQRVSAEKLGLSAVLMGAANSSGGVMGKMIDAQSIVVASTATGWYGHEGDILRFVFKHSLALAALVGGLVMLQAYVWPFTAVVLK
jgi:lactate permease